MTNPEPKFYEITRGEIKPGDYLRVEWFDCDMKVTSEGVAQHQAHNSAWLTTGSGLILLGSPRKNEKIFLREAPMKPLPTEIGTIILIKTVISPFDGKQFHDINEIARLSDDGDWWFFETNDAIEEEYVAPRYVKAWSALQITEVPNR